MLKYTLVSAILLILCATPALARSGCCSHHRGVCGCRCCDGTNLSATCAPYYPSCVGGGTSGISNTPTIVPTRVSTPTPIMTQEPSLTEEIIDIPSPTVLSAAITPTPADLPSQDSKSNGGGILALFAIGGGIWYWRKKTRSKKEEQISK